MTENFEARDTWDGEFAAPGRANAVNRRFLRNAGIGGLLMAVLTYALAVLPGQRQDAAMAEWEKVEAMVTASRVVQEQKTEPWGNSTREYTVHRPEVEYKYTYAGRALTGDQLAQSAPGFRNPAEAEALVTKFAPGSVHEAWVNPSHAEEAVLLRDTPALRTVALIGSAMLGVLGALGLLFSVIKP